MRRSATRAALLSSLLLAMISACNSEGRVSVVPVEGKVTYDGKPLTKGTITFRPEKGPMAVGEIQPDGSYKLKTYQDGDGAVVGTHKVGVIAGDDSPTSMPGSPGYVAPKALIPEKFNNPDTSGLTATVSEAKKDVNFDLK